jgi:hypothetical protein
MGIRPRPFTVMTLMLVVYRKLFSPCEGERKEGRRESGRGR